MTYAEVPYIMGKSRKARAVVVALLLLSSAFAMHPGVAEADTAAPIEITNEFIKITVNPGPMEAGRFGVETTGGDPRNPADDNLPLIYGRPMPWTSYTTIRIDGSDWVFGGRTTRRAGRSGMYGVPTSLPEVRDGKAVCSYMVGDILVTQELSFIKSPSTRYLDTARIHYKVENVGSMTRNVGLRLMIDTMLGANDGAPLRAGERAIVSDTMLSGGEIPDYWQAFDSMVEPSVTAQGTMAGGELTPPGQIAFSDWGSFADNLWDVDLVPGREFVRSKESDLDSAVAMYWMPALLAPGQVRHYVTYYGLGGITLAPGKLALGMTAPAEVGLSADGVGSFLAVAYINNTGEGPAHDVTATLSLPVGFKLAGGKGDTRTVGDLEPGETAQVAWQVVAGWGGVGGGDLRVDVTATNADPNQVSRRVEVLAPPRLLARISHLEALEVRDEKIYPWPVRLTVRVENTGGSLAHWSRVQLDTVAGFEIVGGAVTELLIGTLEPNRPQDFSWILGGHPEAGTHTILVSASAEDAPPSRASASIQVPNIRPRVWARPSKSRVMSGDIFSVDVMITNVPDLKSARFDLRYDDGLVDLAMVSRGALFAAEGVLMPWNEGDLQSVPGRVSGTWGALESPDHAWGSAATFYFKAKKMGDALFSVENLVLTNVSGSLISLGSVPAPCTVQITRQ